MDPNQIYNAPIDEGLQSIKEFQDEKGLDGLILGLETLVINTEPQMHSRAAQELLNTSSYELLEAFTEPQRRITRLARSGSPDILIQTRKGPNPFRDLNLNPKSRFLPNTRLETLIFAVRDLKEFFCLQRTLGTAFLTPDIINYPGYDFIQTVPSRFTNSSLGFIDRKDKTRGYAGPKAQREPKVPEKQNQAYLQDIGPLDHLGLRVAAAERDKASLELMQLTNCTLDLTVTNPSPASITNVLREPVTGLSILLTSGTRLNSGPNEAGPVEQFVANYGRRVHHLAFETANLEDTCYHLSEDGMRFLVDPHGSKDEGLKRALSLPSLYTLLANEYLYRYQGFTGFYPRSKASIRYFEA